jgi:hypothetical protein
MANIKDILASRAAKEEAQKPIELPEWQQQAEKVLKANPSISRATVPSFAESIAKTGYPKNLRFCGVCVHIKDEPDLAEFWKTVYANLTKAEYAELSKPDHRPITESQVASALYRSYSRVDVASELVENGIDAGAMEFESDGSYYVLAAGMVIALDGRVVADVSDLSTPFGPEEWMEVANRIKSRYGSPYVAASNHGQAVSGTVTWKVWVREHGEPDFDYCEEFCSESSAREFFESQMDCEDIAELELDRVTVTQSASVEETVVDTWEA